MKTKDIYEEYMVPKNLQQHMLRVASLAEIILNNWMGAEVNSYAIIMACLFHDIAKPITFDPDKQSQYGMSPKDIKNLKLLQKRIKSNYGTNEHKATVKICQKIGLSPSSVQLVNNLEWAYIPHLLEAEDFESLIPIYCDMRIGPKGIMSVKDRLDDLKERTDAQEYKENLQNSRELEGIINKRVSIDINSITDNQLNQRFEKLLSVQPQPN